MESHSDLLRVCLIIRVAYLMSQKLISFNDYTTFNELLDSEKFENLELVKYQTQEVSNTVEEDIKIVCMYDGSGDSGEVYNLDLEWETSNTQDLNLLVKVYENLLDSVRMSDVWHNSIGSQYGSWGDSEGSRGDCVINIFNLQLQIAHEWRRTAYTGEPNTIDLGVELNNLKKEKS